MSGDVQVSIGAQLSELRKGMDQAGLVVGKFRQDVSRSAASARTFANMIGAIGVEAKGALGAATSLLGSFAAGGMMGLALGGVNALVGVIKDAREEQEKLKQAAIDAAEEVARRQKEIAEMTQKMRLEARERSRGAAVELALAQAKTEETKEAVRAMEREREVQERIAAVRGDASLTEVQKSLRIGPLKEELEAVKALNEILLANARAEDAAAAAKRRAAAAAKTAADEAKRQRDELQRAHAPDTSGEASAGDFFDLEAGGYDPAAVARDALARTKKEQDDYNASVRQSIALNQLWGNAIGSAVGALVTGQASIGQIVSQLGQQIVQTVVQGAISQITANASVAASGAAASQSGIPVVGPVLAISAMGAMLSAVLGLLGNLPSAAGGLMVPSDMLLKVHEDERVLPARYSEGLDDLVYGGRRGGLTVNLTGMDTRDILRSLRKNKSALVQVLRELARDGR